MARRRRNPASPPAPDAAVPGGPGPIPEALARRARLHAAVLTLVALAAYVLTLYPTVPGGDSGELIVVGHLLSVAHPPGYPLYTLLAKAFSLIPAGSIAWRVNLLSAVCDAIAAGLLTLAVARWSRNPWAGLLSGGLFAFSPLVWRYAIAAEVFALNNLFVALTLYLAVRFDEGHRKGFAYLGALAFGLALSNHHTFVFFGIPIAAWVLVAGGPALRTPGAIARLVGCFALGLAPYLYLPLAGASHHVQGWGDPTSVDGFLTHLLRREYGTFRLGTVSKGEGGQLFQRLALYGRSLVVESLAVGIALAAWGCGKTLRRGPGRGLAAAWCVAFLLYAVVFHLLSNLPLNRPLEVGIQARFWQQMNLVVFAFAGLGLAAVAQGLPAARQSWVVAACLLLVGIQAYTTGPAEDRHDDRVFLDFARALVEPLPRDSLLLLTGDLALNAVGYAQLCEGIRPDVRVVAQELMVYPWYNDAMQRTYPDVVRPGSRYQIGKGRFEESGFRSEETRANSYSMADFLAGNLARFPVFVFDGFRSEDGEALSERFYTRPLGLASQVFLHEGGPREDQARMQEAYRTSLGLLDPNTLERHGPDEWEHVVLEARRVLVTQADSLGLVSR